MDNREVLIAHTEIKEKALYGRYLLPQNVNVLLSDLPALFEVKTVGFSVQKREIKSVVFGSGKTRILMWSQMHGNESTTTKSVFDFFNFVQSETYENTSSVLLENCTFCIIPMLNPDGAHLWTRENANNVDLNRDAKELSQPESKILQEVIHQFSPDYCFNLHGQRTIYGFEDTGKSSVLSFLSPAADISREFTFSRKRAASIITHIYKTLREDLPGQLGLYDDAYNGNCVGDALQGLGVATVLFEAGHYPDDYEREVTRKYLFAAIIAAVEATIQSLDYDLEHYLKIPKHSKCFCDVHKKVGEVIERYQYGERLEDGVVHFIPVPFEDEMGSGLFSHKTITVN